MSHATRPPVNPPARQRLHRPDLAVSAPNSTVRKHTAFFTLHVDHGDGPEYYGVYTMVEMVDDTVLDTQSSSTDGNLYKPEGIGASFADGTFSEEVFVKKTNENDADWFAVQRLFAALHAGTRTTDAAAWRADLEAVFDTDAFLQYLAVNTVNQNRDTYGRMTHNCYLYENHDSGRLTRNNWDNNQALSEGHVLRALTLDFAGMRPGEWPLI